MTAISDELILAYRSTEYRVEVPGSEITLRIDEYSAPIAALYAAHGVCSSAFLTAYTPDQIFFRTCDLAGRYRRIYPETGLILSILHC